MNRIKSPDCDYEHVHRDVAAVAFRIRKACDDEADAFTHEYIEQLLKRAQPGRREMRY